MINANADRETRTVAMLTQEQFIASETDHIVLERCTACGKCVEVCPMWPHSAAKDAPADEATARHREPAPHGRADGGRTPFVDACSGSALCRDVCPEGLDAYNMMRIAKVRSQRAGTARSRRRATTT